MENKIERAAKHSLDASAVFTPEQVDAIALAIRRAIDQIQLVVYPPQSAGVPHHTHVVEETNGHTHKLST